MKSTFKKNIEYLGLDYKKEMLILVVLNLVLSACVVCIYLFLKNIVLSLVVLGTLLIANYLYINRYSALRTKLNSDHEDEFISIIHYFQVFIANKNNVYHSFQLLLPYCSEWMEVNLNNMLTHIDNDKTVQPFIEFAKNFTSPVIESVMLSIYQMVEDGASSLQMSEFFILFDQLSRNHQNELIEAKKRSLDTMNSFPLFGAGGVTILLCLSILSVVGEMINVI